MRIVIPERFQLFGQTVTVQYKPDLGARDNAVGEALQRENVVLLQPDVPGVLPRPWTQVEVVYLHEVVHFILGGIARDDLDEDEQFVLLMANALHQVLTSSEGVLR